MAAQLYWIALNYADKRNKVATENIKTYTIQL